MTRINLTQELLKQKLHYDFNTGIFTWISPKKFNVSPGDVAGYMHAGYTRIKLGSDGYLAHRLAWLYMTGEWPKKFIDHINGIRADNRFCNLREATHTENQRNCSKKITNTSGHKGVSWNKRLKKWKTQCRFNGKLLYLGIFQSIHEAISAYEAFAQEHHGEFYRKN